MPQPSEWLKRHHAVDVRIPGEPLRREPLGDLAHDRGRAVHRRQDADEVARRHPAVGAHDALERGALRRRHVLDRAIFAGMRVVAIELAELGVVAVHQRARRDVGGREADDDVVLEDGLALGDRPRGDLVAGRDLAAAGDAFARDRLAERHVDARHDDVVARMQPDHRAGHALFCSFDHEFTWKRLTLALRFKGRVRVGMGRAAPASRLNRPARASQSLWAGVPRRASRPAPCRDSPAADAPYPRPRRRRNARSRP